MSSVPAQEALVDCRAALKSEMSECQCEKSDIMGQAPLLAGKDKQVGSGEMQRAQGHTDG